MNGTRNGGFSQEDAIQLKIRSRAVFKYQYLAHKYPPNSNVLGREVGRIQSDNGNDDPTSSV